VVDRLLWILLYSVCPDEEEDAADHELIRSAADGPRLYAKLDP